MYEATRSRAFVVGDQPRLSEFPAGALDNRCVGERADRAYTHVTSFDSRRQWMICDSLARKGNLSEQGTPQARLLGFVVLRGSPQLLLSFPEEADLRHLSL